MGCASWEVGDWGLRRGSAAQSGGTNRRLVVPCTVGAPLNSRETLFYTVLLFRDCSVGCSGRVAPRKHAADFFT